MGERLNGRSIHTPSSREFMRNKFSDLADLMYATSQDKFVQIGLNYETVMRAKTYIDRNGEPPPQFSSFVQMNEQWGGAYRRWKARLQQPGEAKTS